MYAFDRVTGDPIWPIEERPVPQETNIPGDVLSPTQPFPTKPAPFDYQGVTVDDLVDFTPEIRAMALKAVEGFRLGPLFTPLDRPIEGVTGGTIMRPPTDGTAGWAGAAVDPETGMLYIPSRNRPALVRLYTPDPALGATVEYTHGAPEERMLAGAGGQTAPQMPQGLPLVKPPYSRMTAIDMNTREHAWWVPTGEGNRYRNHPGLRDLNLPPLGGDNGFNGPLLTKTLLLYCLTAGGTNESPRLVAYDKTKRRRTRVGRPPERRYRNADDLHGQRPPVHRAHGRRWPAAHRLCASEPMMQMMQMTQPRRPACRVGLLLALWALACAPAPAQEPASPGVRGVRMVPPTGEGGLYWPRWRGPSGQGVVEETGYTDTWSATTNVQWKTVVPGSGHSSPIVWGDRIFLTTSRDDGRRLSVLSFRRSDGTLLWETDAPDGRVERHHGKNTPASATPTTDRRECLRVVWQSRSGGRGLRRQPGLASRPRADRQLPWPAGSPLLYRDTVIIYQDHGAPPPGSGGGNNRVPHGAFVIALDSQTGETRWQNRTGGQRRLGHSDCDLGRRPR